MLVSAAISSYLVSVRAQIILLKSTIEEREKRYVRKMEFSRNVDNIQYYIDAHHAMMCLHISCCNKCIGRKERDKREKERTFFHLIISCFLQIS